MSEYTDEDIKSLLKNLLLEKKKVQALQEKIKVLTPLSDLPTTTSEEEINQISKLKQLVTVLKEKLEQADSFDKNNLQFVEEAQILKEQLKSQQDELEKMREALHDAHRQIHLQENQSQESLLCPFPEEDIKRMEELKKLLHAAQEQQHYHKLQNDKLVKVIQEKEKRIAELQEFEYGYKKNQAFKQELDQTLHREREKAFELERLYKQATQDLQTKLGDSHTLIEETRKLESLSEQRLNQIQELENQLLTSQENLSSLKQELEVVQKNNDNFQQQISNLQFHKQKEKENFDLILAQYEKDQAGQTTRLKEIEKEFDLAKQTLVKGLREAKELEVRFIEIVGAKADALLKLQQLKDENRQQQEEIKHLKQQIADGINQVATQTTRIDYLEQFLEAAKTNNDTLQARANSLEQNLQELHLAKDELELKYLEDQKTADNLKSALQTTQNEISFILSQKQEIEKNYDTLKQDFQALSLRNEETLHHHEEEQKKFEELLSAYQDKEREQQETMLQLQQLDNDHNKLQENFLQAQGFIAERDGRIKEVQLHLRNKMKEAALLEEKIEEQKVLLAEAQNTSNNQISKLADLQARLESQQEQEKRLQELLNESIKSAESQVGKWEEKYFRMYEKWQEVDAKLTEYKKREEKYQQIEKLLANLGNFIGTPLSIPTPPVPRIIVSEATHETNSSHISHHAPMPPHEILEARKALEMAPLHTEMQEKKQQVPLALDELFAVNSNSPKVRETLF